MNQTMHNGTPELISEISSRCSANWEPAIPRPKLYGVYVLFNDVDAEPLGVEHVIDFQSSDGVFFFIDAAGNRWFLPLATVRWVEVTPMGAL